MRSRLRSGGDEGAGRALAACVFAIVMAVNFTDKEL